MELARLRLILDASGATSGAREWNLAITQVDQGAGKATASVTKMEGALNSAGATMRRALEWAGIAIATKQIIDYADTYKLLEGRLGLVTKGNTELLATEFQLFTLSQQTRQGLEATTSLYTRMARTTKELGISNEDLLGVTKAINQAFVVSGATSVEASASVLQLGQAFASGALRGDELRSVMEQAPRLVEAMSRGMGIAAKDFKRSAEEGKLTTGALVQAILKESGAIEKEFQQMPVTVRQGFTLIGNSMLRTIGLLDKTTGASSSLAASLSWVADHGPQVAGAIGGIAAALTTAWIATQMYELYLGYAATKQAILTSMQALQAWLQLVKIITSAKDAMVLLSAASGPIVAVVGALVAATAGYLVFKAIEDKVTKASKEQTDALEAMLKAQQGVGNSLKTDITEPSKEALNRFEELKRVTPEIVEAFQAMQRMSAQSSGAAERGAFQVDTIKRIEQATKGLDAHRAAQAKLFIEQQRGAEWNAITTRGVTQVNEAMQDNLAALKGEHDAIGLNEAARARLSIQLKYETELREANRAKSNDEAVAIRGAAAAVRDQELANLKANESAQRRTALVQPYIDALTDGRNAAQAFFKDIFKEGVGAFQSLADAIQDIFTTMMGRLIAMKIGQRILTPEMAGLLGIPVSGPQGIASSLGFGQPGNLSKFGTIGVGGAALGYGIGSSMPHAPGWAAGLSGAASGAALGASMGGAPGAAIGATMGLVAALFGHAKAAREAADAERRLQATLEASVVSVRVLAGVATPLEEALAQNHAEFQKLIEDTKAAYEGNRNLDERQKRLQELNRLEAIRVQQLTAEAAALKTTEANANAVEALMGARGANPSLAAAGTLAALFQRGADTAQQQIDEQTRILQDQLRVAQDQLSETKRVVDALTKYSASLVVSDLSPLSPAAKYAESRRQLEGAFTGAMGGDRAAAGSIPDLANTFLTQSHGFNASTAPYGADFARVQEILQLVGDQYGAEVDTGQETVNALNQALDVLRSQETLAELTRQAVIAELTKTRDDAVANVDRQIAAMLDGRNALQESQYQTLVGLRESLTAATDTQVAALITLSGAEVTAMATSNAAQIAAVVAGTTQQELLNGEQVRQLELQRAEFNVAAIADSQILADIFGAASAQVTSLDAYRVQTDAAMTAQTTAISTGATGTQQAMLAVATQVELQRYDYNAAVITLEAGLKTSGAENAAAQINALETLRTDANAKADAQLTALGAIQDILDQRLPNQIIAPDDALDVGTGGIPINHHGVITVTGGSVKPTMPTDAGSTAELEEQTRLLVGIGTGIRAGSTSNDTRLQRIEDALADLAASIRFQTP